MHRTTSFCFVPIIMPWWTVSMTLILPKCSEAGSGATSRKCKSRLSVDGASVPLEVPWYSTPLIDQKIEDEIDVPP